jgi:FMN-dependent NADH-azoreductase
MPRILHITSSPRGASSHSTQIAARVIDELKATHPGAQVRLRDLSRDAPPHIDQDFVTALALPPDQRTPAQAAAIARSDALVDELLAADIVVIGVAMINFAIPSPLKSWLDHVARAGRTFRYGPNGAEGLATGKRVVVVQAKGGIYSGDMKSADFVDPYLRHMLAFMGMADIRAIEVEGTVLGEEILARAVARGHECARHVAGELRAG